MFKALILGHISWSCITVPTNSMCNADNTKDQNSGYSPWQQKYLDIQKYSIEKDTIVKIIKIVQEKNIVCYTKFLAGI